MWGGEREKFKFISEFHSILYYKRLRNQKHIGFSLKIIAWNELSIIYFIFPSFPSMKQNHISVSFFTVFMF